MEAISDLTGSSADSLSLVSSFAETSLHEVTGHVNWAKPPVSLQTP